MKQIIRRILKEEINKPYIKNISDNEVVATTIVGEAGGETDEGMIAIKNVLDNRARKKGTSAAGEALRPRQFSMWDTATSGVSTRDDYKTELIQSVIEQYKNHDKWSFASKIAEGNYKDLTKGANMYYASSGPNKIKPPYWTSGWKETVTIGNHTFGVV